MGMRDGSLLTPHLFLPIKWHGVGTPTGLAGPSLPVPLRSTHGLPCAGIATTSTAPA